jgi:hypothetical protein
MLVDAKASMEAMEKENLLLLIGIEPKIFGLPIRNSVTIPTQLPGSVWCFKVIWINMDEMGGACSTYVENYICMQNMVMTYRGKYVGETGRDGEIGGLGWDCSRKDLCGNFLKTVMNLLDHLEESELPYNLSTIQGELTRKFKFLFFPSKLR